MPALQVTVQLLAVDGDRLAHLGADALHRAVDDLLVRLVVEDQHELVAADARHGVALAQHAAQALGHRLQQQVAGRVAEAVVDELEVVEVHEHHRDGARLALRVHRLAQAVVQQVAVRQAGERVVVRLVLELHLVALALDGVVHRAQQQLAVEPRLDQVVLRPALHRRQRHRLVVVAGEHDDRHRGRVRVDAREGLQPHGVRQRQIQQHQGGLAAGQALQAVRQAIGELQRERRRRVLADHLLDEARVARVVLDQEDVMGRGANGLPYGCPAAASRRSARTRRSTSPPP